MMKTAFVAAVSLLLVAGTALAGPAFASSFSDPGLSTASISTSSGGSFAPAGLVTVSGQSSPPSAFSAVLDYTFSPAADFNTPGHDVVLYFGSISGSMTLTSVGISEDGGSTFTTQSMTNVIDSSLANSMYFIGLSSGAGGIPVTSRDAGDVVRLSFNLGSTDSFVIDGVSNPEPSTFALFGLGLLALAGFSLHRRRRAAAA